jgi:hypothetical protein
MDNELLLNMEVVLTPDVYQLSTDDDGNFYDSISYIKTPVTCPCGTRTNKSFTRKTMAGHIKCKTHKSWVCEQNSNKGNILADNYEKTELIKNQREIINNENRELCHKVQILNTKIQTSTIELEMYKRQNISKKLD